MTGSFTVLEHPSDVGIEARGDTLAEAFQFAAVGLMSIIVDLSRVAPKETREIGVAATDPEQLLVRWLSEVLFLYDGNGFVGKEFAVREWSGTGLRAVVGGETFDPGRHAARTDVKAVTYHQLTVEESIDGARVRFFVDV